MFDRFISHINFGIIITSLNLFDLRKSNSDCPCKPVRPSNHMIDCTGIQELEGIPVGCDKSAKGMDLSGSSFNKCDGFNSKTFENYTYLTRIIMRGTKIYCNKDEKGMEFKADAFKSLKLLEELNLDETRLKFDKTMKWPPKLKTLQVTKTQITEIPSMVSLEDFQQFYGGNNKFRKLPDFNTEKPMMAVIDLKDNPLDELVVSQIAPFCKLTDLEIRVNDGGKFAKPEKYCECIRLQKWMKQKEIRGAEYLNCNSGSGDITEKSCNIDFAAELESYEKCKEQEVGTSIVELLVYAALFSVLFPVLYFFNEIYSSHVKAAIGLGKRRSSTADQNESDFFADDDAYLSPESVSNEHQ